LSALGAFARDSLNLVGGGEPQRVEIGAVTADVLPLLGVPPLIGRVFASGTHDDDSAAVISYGLWQSAFAGDRAVLGRTVNLNGAGYTVIGVMPPAFYFPDRNVELWKMLVLQEEDFADRGNTYLQSVGRLKDGVTFEQARAELTAISLRLGREHPDTNAETGISFFRMRDYMSPRSRLMLLALGGATLCLLLLTCANLANLLLARASARERELALRAALGAGKERLVRQMITESVILTLLGGAAGVLVAIVSLPLFATLVPPTLPLASAPSLDLRVLAFAAVFTALTALGFGLFPALRAGSRTGFAALREGSRGGTGRRQRARAVLVTVEVSMSVILLITSGLLLRAMWRVQSIDPGFVTEQVLTLQTTLPRPEYDSASRRVAFYTRVLSDVRALPGVESAAFTSGLPMVLTGGITGIQLPGQPALNRRTNGVSMRFVTPQFFGTMRIPILEGRDVEDGDGVDRAWVAVVSASFARRYWPDQDPIGKSFLHLERTRTVVGVVGDISVRGLERTSEPQMYLPAAQIADDMLGGLYDPKALVIRHSGSVGALVPPLRRIIRAADPDQPISDLRTLDDVLAGDTAPRRAQLQLLGVLAAVALLLSGIGIYGLLAYTLSQRAQEIAVRLALGAEPASVGRMIFADGLRLAAFGIVPGIIGAYAAARGMSTLLFGIEPSDPITFVAVVGVALAMTCAGSFLPAVRAVRITPMAALKAE
jgi:predicted permease